MLTPRRTLMMLAGFVLFGTAYWSYFQLLGWIDGLPQLPEEMKQCGDGTFRPPVRSTSPTQQKLLEAFGANALETEYSHYPNQFSFVYGDSLIVVAAGPLPANPNSTRVPVAPFSVAIFGKPKPLHLMQPGEVPEISTVHSDKAILEFDREIKSPNDMRTARLVRMELVSDAEIAGRDPRAGLVHITNNQRSHDPDNRLVLRTPGPVFYRDANLVAGTPAAEGPDFWTDAPVEIVDQQNVPRPFGSTAPTTAPAKGTDLRDPQAVADILGGRRAAPPTVSAVGLRLYLVTAAKSSHPASPRGPTRAIHGVRRIEFLEKVLVNLWIDGRSSWVGQTPPTSPNTSKNALVCTPPPAALAVFGPRGPAAYMVRLHNRALLQIETRGPFAYDAEKAIARFDVVPESDPNIPNDVQVTRVTPQEPPSHLFSQVLELEFDHHLPRNGRSVSLPTIKKLHAWTYTPGRLLTVTSHSDNMQAYGHDLVHDRATQRTILTGAPLYVLRDQNVLTAGHPQRPATLTTQPGPKPGDRLRVTVEGPGRVELFDKASNTNTLAARWQTSLVQTKDILDGFEQDLFIFTDAAQFEDVKADYWLKGNVLKLWLQPTARRTDTDPAVAFAAPVGGSTKPSKVQAMGNVSSHSADFDIEQADQLHVFFSDAQPGPTEALPPPDIPRKPMPDGPPTLPPSQPAPGGAAAPEPKPPAKPPIKIRAKDIQTWVQRIAREPDPNPPAPARAATVKYQLERARCEDNVSIHQDAADATKSRGIDILARLLLIDGAAEGHILTVFGWPGRPAEVHHEEMSLIGPEIKLDQVHNAASVKGRGALRMPTTSDLSGSQLKESEIVVIHWRDSMDFKGALRCAEFEGKVSATQGHSWVLCHTMHITFDQPIYFNTTQRQAAEKGAKPKIETVRCYPAPGDAIDDRQELRVSYRQVEVDETGKILKTQQLDAVELRVEAQVQDGDGKGKYRRVTAFGPGEVRIWQPGDKNLAGPLPPPAPAATTTPPVREVEMQLTIVTFNRTMVAIDKGKIFQQATFTDTVTAFHVPAPTDNVTVSRQNLPRGGILLTCNKELVVWSQKKANEPTVQRLDAVGNAYLRSDDYEGWGEKISNDGHLVRLEGHKSTPARIMNRFHRGNDQLGEIITYDRATGAFKVVKSYGGTLSTAPR
ncbi:MAG: hypothetical protein RMJ56_00150 [Gemmataceae bacterium]|nr:hypothetical protein [Gemmataceae bacterium]